MKSACRLWAPAAISAAVALILYAISLGGTYIYDDAAIITLDQRVQHPKLWPEFWTHDWWFNGSEDSGAIDNLYRPLVSQSFGIQWWLHGDRAWAFHLINILLHAVVSALVAEFGCRLANARVGLIAGLLFACHPVHSEAVAGIVGRTELACALGVVGALVVFLKQPMTTRRALAIFALTTVAMFSKEQGMLAPILLGALIPVRRQLFPNRDPREKKPMQIAFILVMFLAVGLINLRESVLKLKFEFDRGFLDPTDQPLINSPPIDRWLIPVSLVGRYFSLLVAPYKLSIDYGMNVIGPTVSRSNPYLIAGALIAIAWTVATTITLLRRKWIVFYCLLAMGLTYAVVSNIVIAGTIFGERLMYLPSVFFLILVAVAIARLPDRVQIGLVTIVLLLACIRTWTYVQKWNDRDSFYVYSLAQQPESIKIKLLVSYVAYEENRLNDAKKYLDELSAVNPDYWEIWKRYAAINEKEGDWNAAAANWKRAFYIHPDMAVENKWAAAMAKANNQHAATQTSRP